MSAQKPSRRWPQKLQVLVALRAPTLGAAWVARHASPPPTKEIRSVLIIRMDGIGDAVLTLPLIQRLRVCLPQTRLIVLTREDIADVFRMSTSVDEVLAMPRPAREARLQLVAALSAAVRFAWQHLRRRTFDATLNPRWDVDVTMATLLTALSRAPLRIGYEDATSSERFRLNRGFRLAHTHVLPAGPLQHEALRAAALAVPLGCFGEVIPPRLAPETTPPAAIRKLRRLHPGTPLLVIGLPAGSPHRRWPATHFIATIQAIRANHPFTVFLISDSTTTLVAEAIQAALPDVMHLSKLSLTQLASAIAACDIFLGGDTGIGHIAAAVGCPVVTISPHPLGAELDHTNSPMRFRPFTSNAIVLQPTFGRAGCEEGCNAAEPHCILDVTAQQAADAVITLHAKKHSQTSQSFNSPI